MAYQRLLLATLTVLVVGPFASAQGVFRIGEREELELGKRLAIEIEIDEPMLEDTITERYVQSLGQRLARDSARPNIRYRFKVLNSDEVNAFALPGGYIFVTRGMLESVKDENELAGVLAHEIGHIAARQHAKRVRRSQLTNLGFSLMGPVVGGGAKMAAGRIAGRSLVDLIFTPFNREDEREADRLGAKNMHDAKFDPAALVSFFERSAAGSERQPGRFKQFFASHPRSEERAAEIAEFIGTLPEQTGSRANDAELARVKERLSRFTASASAASTREAAVVPVSSEDATPRQERDREVAALFAPIFHHGLGTSPRYDYITNFDFDGDWRGDNNWRNAADRQYKMNSWVYYAVRETATHWLVHYAAFHPRDYKGGERRGTFLSRGIRAAVNAAGRYDPTGRAEEAVLAHENDLEGALVVVEKRGDDPARGRVVFVETMAHNTFLKYVPEDSPREGFATVPVSGRHVRLFIEPRGHGIQGWRGDDEQLKQSVNGIKVYTFTGAAEDGDLHPKGPTGYDLAPIYETLWLEALRGSTPAYAETQDYGSVFVKVLAAGGVAEEREIRVGRVGTAFRGSVGGKNLARPPWAWFDGADRNQPLGEWFFDPARAIRRHYELDESFPVAYVEYEIPAATLTARE
jgi:Zn-dependent protease with chaperone function